MSETQAKREFQEAVTSGFKNKFGGDAAVLETLPIASIKPYWRNPRINKDAVGKVKASIERFGFLVPIVISKDFTIITGHTRYKALIELGWKEVPCLIADMSPEQETEFRIVDNKTSEAAYWDMDLLVQELKTLPEHESIQEYFDDLDLDLVLNDMVSIKQVTAGEIEEIEEELSNRFEESSKNAQSDYVDIICSHCGETCTVSRSEMNRSALTNG